jgi:DNA-directed RNA polymerase omega subunit
MINIDLKELIKDDLSRYALVVAVSKRSREIVDKANAEKEILVEKPVSIAIGDFLTGDCTVDATSVEEAHEEI